jgi:hypothetical protein
MSDEQRHRGSAWFVLLTIVGFVSVHLVAAILLTHG